MDEEEDVERQLAVVEEELKKREKRLALIIDEIERAKSELGNSSVRDSLRQGDIGKMKVIQSHQKTLRALIEKKEILRAEAESDVKRARERKAMLLEEKNK